MASKKNKRLIYSNVRKYVQLLQDNKIPVKTVYLFGSYVNGKENEFSDIDLAIVTNRFIGDSFDFRFMLTRMARDIDSDIEPHPYLLSDFNNNNPVAAEILKSGIKIL